MNAELFSSEVTRAALFKKGHLPHRMSPHFVTYFIDLLTKDGKNTIFNFFSHFFVNTLQFK